MRVVRKALTFDDVLLVPAHSLVVPREVSLKTRLTRGIALNIPIVSAAMDTVTEARLAIAHRAGRRHRHRPQEHAAGAAGGRSREGQALRERRRQGPDHDPADDDGARRARADAAAPDLRACRSSKASASSASSPTATCASRRISTSRSSAIMTPGERLVTVPEGTDLETAKALMHRHRLERVLVVNERPRAARPHHRQGHPEVDRASARVQGRARPAARRRRGRRRPPTPRSASRLLVAAGVDVHRRRHGARPFAGRARPRRVGQEALPARAGHRRQRRDRRRRAGAGRPRRGRREGRHRPGLDLHDAHRRRRRRAADHRDPVRARRRRRRRTCRSSPTAASATRATSRRRSRRARRA